MSAKQYDAIVVGARCAGSPTAMLLARQGYQVLVVDKATFPSDTVSTHLIHTPGVQAMKRWGLLDRLVATGCAPISTYAFDFGPFTITGSPAIDETPASYAQRRTVLDQLLVDAAREAGAEVREAFTVDEVLVEDGQVTGIRGHERQGATVTERARVVVGADGRNSRVAQAVMPARYNEKPPLLMAYYSYWSGLPMHGRFETYIRPNRGFAAWPVTDEQTLIVGGWPYAEAEANKGDIEGNFLNSLGLVPGFAERVGAARREERFVGAAVHNYYRKPYGPGWCLVGDAAYNKDFITAQGIQDAFLQAELCAAALDETMTGGRSFDEAMSDFQSTRDAHTLAMYEFTCQLATLEPPPPELQQLLGAVHGNHDAMDAFARLNAGAMSPAEFFSEQNIGQIFAATAG
jgi:2-polyprenyl-6-methoxyphenol hydroxylase-like FAD-dependent oxidoreductase